MCALSGSINVPWQGSKEKWVQQVLECQALTSTSSKQKGIYLICRNGNDSQLAVHALLEAISMQQPDTNISVKDIEGGLRAWRQSVDPEWPDY